KRDNANIIVCLKKLNNSNGALKEFLQEKDNLNDSSKLSKQIREIESSEEKLQIYDSNRSSPNYDTLPLASYTSQILDYKNLSEPRNATYKGAIDHNLEI
ncbi:16846_t:CDS:2, partial [Gigaspora margarita]